MHFHCEIIMPICSDISKAVSSVLSQFSENNEEQTGHEFWDWYVIGGRWAGTKETCRYDAEKIEQFYKRLKEKKVTVSGLQCGKQEIRPSDQIPMVDEMWNKLFPTEDGTITPCPLFAHSNNQYDSNDLLACDICRVDEIPDKLNCARVIIAGPDFEGAGLEPHFMVSEDFWNGINDVTTTWDGKVKSALVMFEEKLKNYTEQYKEKVTPQPDWICVTIDYHS